MNVRECKLTDSRTDHCVHGVLSRESSLKPSILSKDRNDPYLKLLSKFPALTQASPADTCVKHNAMHHIATTGLASAPGLYAACAALSAACAATRKGLVSTVRACVKNNIILTAVTTFYHGACGSDVKL